MRADQAFHASRHPQVLFDGIEAAAPEDKQHHHGKKDGDSRNPRLPSAIG
jgi:hypothetical protein